MDYLLGIDLGGTKSAAVVGTADGQMVARASGPTPQGGMDAIVPFLAALARETMAQSLGTVVALGISAGAPADAKRGLVFNAPNLSFTGTVGESDFGVPLAALLSQELGGLPAALENDADATALAEYRFGAGQGCDNMAFLTVGTGIGAGLILDGKLHRGASGAGGEVGHIAVVPDGRLCKCGLRGCLEAYASGPSLVRVAQERGFTGGTTGQGVIAGARYGDKAALFAVSQAGEMLGRGIASLVMLLNVERVVLGTLAVHAGDLLLPTVRETVTQHTWPRLHTNLTIVPAALGDRAQDLAALCVAASVK